MYRCQITGRLSREGDKLNKIVAQTRIKEYKHRNPETDEEWSSFGTEIVQELNATDAGVELWNTWSEEKRASFLKGR